MNHNFTQQIKDWLDTPFAERDFEKGALYLLKLSRNQIRYRNIIANPKGESRLYRVSASEILKFPCSGSDSRTGRRNGCTGCFNSRETFPDGNSVNKT